MMVIKSHLILLSSLILSSVAIGHDKVLLGDNNFTDYLTTSGDYQLVNNIYLNNTNWIPVGNNTHRFNARLDGNGYIIYGIIINEGNNPAGFINYASGAEFYNLSLQGVYIAGSPAVGLVVNADNTIINNVRINGSIIGNIGNNQNDYGDSGGNASGVIDSGTHITLNNITVIGVISGGNGGNSQWGYEYGGGNGGNVAGIMNSGNNATISNVRVCSSLNGGNGGRRSGNGGHSSGLVDSCSDCLIDNAIVDSFIYGGNSGRPGHASDHGHNGIGSGISRSLTNSRINNIFLSSSVIGGTSPNDYTNNGRKGGDASGVVNSGINSVIDGAVIASNIIAGNGVTSRLGRLDAGGDASGIVLSGKNLDINDVLVAGSVKSGKGGRVVDYNRNSAHGISYGILGSGINSTLNNALTTASLNDDGPAYGIIGSNSNTTLNNTHYNTNITRVSGGQTTTELKMPSTYSGAFRNWRIVEDKYPFPEAVDGLYLQVRVNETVPLDCGEYACPPDQPVMPTTSITQPSSTEELITTTILAATPTPSPNDTCLFTPQSPGTLEYLLYDGQRYHGVVKVDGSSLAYWIVYKGDSYLALEPCGVYGFTDISSAGIVVDAAVNHGNTVYIAYHVPALAGQSQPGNSRLEMLTLSDGQLQRAAFMPTPTDDRITSLSIDGSDVLLNTGQAIYRLSNNNQLTSDLQGSHALRSGEVIQSVSGKGGDLYLLTHEPGTGYRIRTVPESGTATFLMVTTPSGVTTSKKVVASLKVSGDRLHLLMIDSRSIIWRKYRLDTLVDAPGEAQESEAFAPLPQDTTPAAIALLPGQVVNPDSGQDQVLIMGQNSSGQPRYGRLMPADFTPGSIATSILAATPTPSPDSNGDNGYGIGEWPWWAKTLFGTVVSVTGLTVFTTLSCLVKKGWNHYRQRGGKPDYMKKVYQQLKLQTQRSTQDRQGQPRVGLPLSGILSRPGFRGNPDGSIAISVEPVYVQPNGLGQTPSGYLDVIPSEAQSVQLPIAPQYEEIVPREERVPQIAQEFGNPNEVHDYEDLETVEVRATEQRHEYHEQEPVQRLKN